MVVRCLIQILILAILISLPHLSHAVCELIVARLQVDLRRGAGLQVWLLWVALLLFLVLLLLGSTLREASILIETASLRKLVNMNWCSGT